MNLLVRITTYGISLPYYLGLSHSQLNPSLKQKQQYKLSAVQRTVLQKHQGTVFVQAKNKPEQNKKTN